MSREYTCKDCAFTTSDIHLLDHHSCDVALNGGNCEDYPCCGHEYGDCNGMLYGSSEAIYAQVEREWNTGHGMCDHESGIYNCEGNEDEPDDGTCKHCGNTIWRYPDYPHQWTDADDHDYCDPDDVSILHEPEYV